MSARSAVEQAKSHIAAQTSLPVNIHRGTALRNGRRMQSFWRQGGKKPIARKGCEYRYPGSRTSSAAELATQVWTGFPFQTASSSNMNQEDGFGAVIRSNERVKLEIRSKLTAPSPGNTLAQAVQ